MAKHKYRFDPETLRYERIENRSIDKLKKGGTFFLLGVVVSFIGLYFLYDVRISTKHQRLKQKNEFLVEQYQELDTQLQQIEGKLASVRERDDELYRTIFGAEPIPENIRKAGFGGSDRYEHLKGYPYSDLLIKTHKKLDQVEKRINVQHRSFKELSKLAKERSEFLDHVPAIQPIRGDMIERIASGFGMRLHPIYHILKMHAGIDFTLERGTEIHATGDGVVESIERDKVGYGKNIIIDHGFGYKTLYAHLKDFKVREGQKIKRGDVIGLSGNTGTSTAPHLHYEVIKDGKKVDPVNYFFNDLDTEEYQKVVAAAERTEKSL